MLMLPSVQVALIIWDNDLKRAEHQDIFGTLLTLCEYLIVRLADFDEFNDQVGV